MEVDRKELMSFIHDINGKIGLIHGNIDIIKGYLKVNSEKIDKEHKDYIESKLLSIKNNMKLLNAIVDTHYVNNTEL